MNKKGFTIIEVLAVVVILGILSTIATMEVYRYKKFANQKEIVNLKSTIADCYDNYRQDTIINNKGPIVYEINNTSNSDILNNYFTNLTYDGKSLDLTSGNFKLEMKKKGDVCPDNSDSKEEILCMSFEKDDNVLFNDFNDNNSLCNPFLNAEVNSSLCSDDDSEETE